MAFLLSTTVLWAQGRGGNTQPSEPAQPGKRISYNDVQYFPDANLYDETVLRTFFFKFDTDEWNDELGDFYRTGFEIAAKLIVDGKVYDKVGVRLRGNTSSSRVPQDRKRSLNISLDYEYGKQQLYGYKTLNLLNAHTDPTFMREMLFNYIARNYLPAAKANYVRVVVNGENWGIYINSQQFNKDFLDDWYGTRKGVRWKAPANPRLSMGLAYRGDSPANYPRQYELLSATDERQAWSDLINLTKSLASSNQENYETVLAPVLNIDRALWFIALENVLIDNDGYWIRASDFMFYQDTNGRFHMVPHDNNETFKTPGGPGFRGGAGLELSPISGESDDSKPLIRFLFAIPELRARYLAHVRTIAEEWLDWDVLGPVVERYRQLIEKDIQEDTRKLYSYEDFVSGLDQGGERLLGLQRFVTERAKGLLNDPNINRPTPKILSVSVQPADRAASQAIETIDEIRFLATVDPEVPPASVLLYWVANNEPQFHHVAMEAVSLNRFEATLPRQTVGTELRYYVEARADTATGTTYFMPRGAEFAALRFQVTAPVAETSAIVISEIMSSNSRTIADSKGEFSDWIELQNISTQTVDLSGFHLSDSAKQLRKWMFPEGTTLKAGETLIVWADGDDKNPEDLHANFRLSNKGERLLLSDTDANGNVILDAVKFGKSKADEAFSRTAPEVATFQIAVPSPGVANL